MKKIFLTLLLSANLTYAAGIANLADYLISSSGVIEVLGKYGVKGEEAMQVKSYVQAALEGLAPKGKTLSRGELMEMISKIPATGKDAEIKKELQIALSKSGQEVKKEDMVKAINHLIYLAQRSSKAVFYTCSDCVNEGLAIHGFKFAVKAITDSNAKAIYEKTIPKDSVGLTNFISQKMRSQKLGDYAKATPDLVSPTDEKSLAYFLQIAETGNPAQKAYVEAVKKISTTDGKVVLLDPKNPHKFWREMEGLNDQQLEGWTRLLNKVAEERGGNNKTAEEDFYNVLKKMADENPSLKSDYELIVRKRCFGIKN